MLKTEIIQKAIVRRDDGKILVVRRSKTDTRRPLQWDLPGGMLDEGETLEDCIKREIKEETGITVNNTKLIYSKTEARTWDKGQANAVFLFYYAKTKTDEVILSFEHDQFKWVNLAKALEMFEYYLHKGFLAYVIDNQLEL